MVDFEKLEKEQGSKWSALKKKFQRDYNNLSLKRKVNIRRDLRKTLRSPFRVDELAITDDGIKTIGTYHV